MNFNSSHLPDLRAIFTSVLQAVQGQACVSEYLHKNPVQGKCYLLAIGKAACSMARGAQMVLGDRIIDSLVITRHAYCETGLSGMHVLEAGHPLPDASSIEAGKQLLEFVQTMPETATLLCLISGGASSLVEVLPETVSFADLQHLNQWLLQSGLAIAEINFIRKQVSCIKGGRLAAYLRGRQTIVLLMSDVQGDDPAVIGSGLLFAPQAGASAVDITKLPANIQRLLRQSPPLPDIDDPCFNSITWKIVANVSQAMRVAEYAACMQGYPTLLHQSYLQGDAIECGRHVAHILQTQPNVLHIWGGETTLRLPKNPGKGGRCQSLALSAAIAMRGKSNWCMLAAGTDGSDGVMNAAGVCVDAGSLQRAEHELSGEAQRYLDAANAGTFFTASSDLLVTGPTGTNVNDLVLGYRGA